MYSQGLNKMTIGSCALEEYKNIVGKKTFKRWYPTPEYHNDVKTVLPWRIYLLNPKFASVPR